MKLLSIDSPTSNSKVDVKSDNGLAVFYRLIEGIWVSIRSLLSLARLALVRVT